MTDNAVSHPLAQRIASLRLPGMLAAFLEQMAHHDLDDMTFEDRLGPQTFGGPASGGAQTLFGQPVPVEQDATGETGDGLDRRRLDARLGYGFGVFGDRWTAVPALGLGLSDSDREYRLGGRLERPVSAGLDFGIDLEGNVVEADASHPTHQRCCSDQQFITGRHRNEF